MTVNRIIKWLKEQEYIDTSTTYIHKNNNVYTTTHFTILPKLKAIIEGEEQHTPSITAKVKIHQTKNTTKTASKTPKTIIADSISNSNNNELYQIDIDHLNEMYAKLKDEIK